MKKALLFIAAAVALAAACTRETPDSTLLPQEEGQPLIFEAIAEASESDTKAGYNNDTKFFWTPGDQIEILCKSGSANVWNVATNIQTVDGLAKGIFSTGTYHWDTEFVGVAQYPAALESPAEKYNGNTFVLGLPAQYNLENVSPVFMPLVAKVTDEHASVLNFKHVGGAVKVVFQNVPDSHVKTFRLLSDKKVCGEFTMNLSGLGTSSCVAKTASTNIASEKMVEVKYMSSGFKQLVTIYFPVPTGSMKFGLQVLLDGKEYYYKPIDSESTTNTVNRCTILQMPTVYLTNNVGPVMIDQAHYSTIQEAVDAAKNGQTILVKPGVYEEDVIVNGKNVTIKPYSTDGTVTVNSIEAYKSALTLQDIILKPTENTKSSLTASDHKVSYGILVHTPGNGFSASNVKIDLSQAGEGAVGIYLGRGTSADNGTKRDSFTGCTVTGEGKALLVSNGGIADFISNTFSGGTSDYAVKVVSLINNAVAANNLSFSGNKFTGTGKAGIEFADLQNSTITIGGEDGDNNIFSGFTYPYHANKDVTYAGFNNTFVPGAMYDDTTGEVTIKVPDSVAFIGETGYTTVQKAVDAATAGQTVTVVEGTFNEDIIISKKITLKGAGDGTVISSVAITGGVAATVCDLTVKPVNTTYGIHIGQSGKGATVKNVNFNLAKSGVYGLIVEPKSNGTTADTVQGCIFTCNGNIAIEAASAVLDILANEFDNPSPQYAVCIFGISNKVTLASNDFTGVVNPPVLFQDMSSSSITFGDGQGESDDSNTTSSQYLCYGTGSTLTSQDNVFAPTGYFDEENNNVFVFGKKLVLTLQVERVWGMYSTSSASWNASFCQEPGSDHSIAMDGSYIYLPETLADKKLWAISVADKSVTAVPTGTVKEEGEYYLSCARMIGGVLAVSNVVTGTDYPTLYVYNNGIAADPDILELKTGANPPDRAGDTFSAYGTLTNGWLASGFGNTMHVWKLSKTSGSISQKGYYSFSTNPGSVFTYNPYPEDINAGVLTTLSGAYAATPDTKFSALYPSGVMNLTASSSGAVAVQFFEYKDHRYVAFATQDSDTEGYLCIRQGSASDAWATILNSGKDITEPIRIHALNNTYASDNNFMDVAVYEAGDEVYIACLKQGVGLSLFKLYEDYE